MKKQILSIIISFVIITSFPQTVFANEIVSSFDFKPYSYMDAVGPVYQDGNETYEVISYAQVRTSMSKYSPVKDQLYQGDYIINANSYINEYGNEWVLYYDDAGSECWVYIEHLELHHHSYEVSCEGDKGDIEICECGAINLNFKQPFSVRCRENTFCQIIAGNFSDSQSYVSVSVNYAIGSDTLVKISAGIPIVRIALAIAHSAAKIRDFAADAYYSSYYCIYDFDEEMCEAEIYDVAWEAFGELGVINDPADFIYSYVGKMENLYENNGRVVSYNGGYNPFEETIEYDSSTDTCSLLKLP